MELRCLWSLVILIFFIHILCILISIIWMKIWILRISEHEDMGSFL